MTEHNPDENSVTTAIKVAGSHYAQANGLRWPTFSALANNQQGPALDRLCGDLLAAFGDYKVGLFEVKELVGQLLPQFKDEQHQDCLDFQELGVPIEYAYGPAKLLEQLDESDLQSPGKILKAIKHCVPSELPGKVPKAGHETLQSWFDEMGQRGGGKDTGDGPLDMWTALGCAEGAMRSSSVRFRNSHLILLYSAKHEYLKLLTPDELLLFADLLKGRIGNMPDTLGEPLGRLLDQSARVQDAFRRLRASRSQRAIKKSAAKAIELTNSDGPPEADTRDSSATSDGSASFGNP
jgi:hypothetical protein